MLDVTVSVIHAELVEAGVDVISVTRTSDKSNFSVKVNGEYPEEIISRIARPGRVVLTSDCRQQDIESVITDEDVAKIARRLAVEWVLNNTMTAARISPTLKAILIREEGA